MTRPISVLFSVAIFAASGNAQALEDGKKQFDARCVGCHGSDGTGGGHGPSFVDVRQSRATSKEATRDLILKGIPDLGMPAFPMSSAEADLIVAYVGALKAPAADNPVAGDSVAGERFFTGKGDCSSCHMVRGRGGVTGPDLSNLGREKKLGQIEQALKDPGSVPAAPAFGGGGPRGGGGAPSYKAVTVRTRNGRTIRGLAKSESSFDLAVQGADGKFYSFSKDQLTQVTPEKSLMPKVDATPEEMGNLLAYLSRLSNDRSERATLTGTAQMGEGVKFADIARPKPGEWPSYNGQMSGNRNTPLKQITPANVTQLAPKWIFPVPGAAQRGLETTPIVVDGMMYVTAVNEAWGLDARTGRQIWHYGRPQSQGLAGDAASGKNRGVAVLGDRVFMVTDNAHTIALHRLTGQLLWDAEMADSRQNYGATGAPLVVNDLVISGVSGGDEGIRGFLDAYKASTGERMWRFWTIPARGEPGSETWQGKAMEHGCGATWLTGTYDPDAKLLYWPTGNPCPDYNGAERKGDNLYTSSIVALDPETGKLKWHYQPMPHDLHDWDATETPMLIDANFRGRPRKLLVQAHRNGFFFVLDRLTGEFLMAEPFVKNMNWGSGYRPDGRPKLLAAYEPTVEGSRVCPAVSGSANWQSNAFSPETGLYYVMATESCATYTKNDNWWVAGQSFYGGGTRRGPGEPPVPGAGKFLRALDLQTGKTVWEIPELGGTGSGVMATAGGLLFYGDGSNSLVAVDLKSGKALWHFYAGQGWRAGPMSYAIDGNQYIGATAGSLIMVFGLP